MIPEILNSYQLNLQLLHRLVADLAEEQMTLQPGGVTNHPAWTLGHLTLSAQEIGAELGMAPWLPPEWPGLFGMGSTPLPRRNAYPDRDALLGALDDARQRVAARLSEMSGEQLAEPLPDVRYRTYFPTNGHAALHILASHTALHVGQITTWRRAAGLPAMPEL